ncbi:MAG: DNA topoisomerase 1 [Smithella sp. PtaU1.Bin162]|nr:MAG: DNA topoisomerase 1 [Smithella sp. PtaU1.Bin162]
MEDIVRNQFNQILTKHYERLTGSKNIPGGLHLSLDNIGCLILFGGRELEMADITSEVSDRYTLDEFLEEIKDAGIENDKHFQKAMQELIDRKYIEHRPDGHIHGYSDTKETARILNRIFPKMQGLNLLAYIWQTIAEAVSGRTDLEAALSRFDQTLNNHGVIPSKPKVPVITPDPKPRVSSPVPEKKESGINRPGSRIIRDYVVSETPVRAELSAQKPVGISVDDHSKTERQKEIKITENEQKIQEEKVAMQQKIAELEKLVAQAEEEKQTAAAAPPEEETPVKKEEPAEIAEEIKEEETVPVDAEIAEKIAAFEKELALTCPICKTGILEEKSTAAGKVFYACGSGSCNFISWGKPHNIPCIRCKNPFLIEATDASGQTFLRCPRATCQHRQSLNPAGVKVVRKRLVRRRK